MEIILSRGESSSFKNAFLKEIRIRFPHAKGDSKKLRSAWPGAKPPASFFWLLTQDPVDLLLSPQHADFFLSLPAILWGQEAADKMPAIFGPQIAAHYNNLVSMQTPLGVPAFVEENKIPVFTSEQDIPVFVEEKKIPIFVPDIEEPSLLPLEEELPTVISLPRLPSVFAVTSPTYDTARHSAIPLLHEAHQQLESLSEEKGLTWAQTDALRAIKSDIESGYRRVYADMAMGSGKTAIELTYLEACYRAGINVQGSIFTLGDADVQNILENEAPRWAPELFKSGKLTRFMPSKPNASPYTIATYAAGIEGLNRGSLQRPDIMFLDEAHGVLSQIRQGLFASLGSETQLVGLTATPAYSEKKSLNRAGYKESYRLPFDVAVARSLLCSYRNILLEVTDPRLSLDNLDVINGEYDDRQTEKMLRHESVLRVMRSFFAEWRDPETGNSMFDGKGMISCASVGHAIDVAKLMNTWFGNLMPSGVRVCEPIWGGVSISGNISRRERDAIKDRHKNRETLFLASQNYLMVGHDDKEIDTMFNMRPLRSMVLMPQRGGRPMRYNHDNPYKVANIVDMVFQGERNQQKIFAEYAGDSFMETIERQRLRAARQLSSPVRKITSQQTDGVADKEQRSLPTTFKVYYEAEEVRSFILTKERREVIAKRPWLAEVTPLLIDSLIKADVSTINALIIRIRQLAVLNNWDDDVTKKKGAYGALSEIAIRKALRGGFAAERTSANKQHYDQASKAWERAERDLQKAQEKYQQALAADKDDVRTIRTHQASIARHTIIKTQCEKNLSTPVEENYSMAEIAIATVLSQHPSTVFGHIAYPKENREQYESYTDNGAVISLIPEGKRRMRSLPLANTLYEPDYIFPQEAIGPLMEERGGALQKDFNNILSDTVLSPLYALLARDEEELEALEDSVSDLEEEEIDDKSWTDDSGFDRADATNLITDILEELMELEPLDEARLRRAYQYFLKNEKNYNDFIAETNARPLSAEAEYENAIVNADPSPVVMAPDIHELMNQKNAEQVISRALLTLTPREELVLRLRYGILGNEGRDKDKTLEEVGMIFDVSRERIRQIEGKALRKLKHPSRSKALRTLLVDGFKIV